MKVFTHSFSFGNAGTKNIPTGINLLIRNCLLILGFGFILAIVFLGIEKVSQFCSPYLVPSARISIAVFLLCIYPLSFINRLRPFLVVPSQFLSYLLGACAWVYSLLFVVNSLGFWGILFCFLFQTLTPITLMGAVFKGSWNVVGTLSLWLIFTYMIRFFSATLIINYTQQTKEDKIIDIEAQRKD